MADAFEELNSVRAGRGRGIRAVLPAAWSLEAGPMGPAEGPDFIWSMRGPPAGYKQEQHSHSGCCGEMGVGRRGEMARGGEG